MYKIKIYKLFWHLKFFFFILANYVIYWKDSIFYNKEYREILEKG